MRNIFGIVLLVFAIPLFGKTYKLQSPNKRLQVEVASGETLTWRIMHDGREVMQLSRIDINNAYQGKVSPSATKHYKTTFPTPRLSEKATFLTSHRGLSHYRDPI